MPTLGLVIVARLPAGFVPRCRRWPARRGCAAQPDDVTSEISVPVDDMFEPLWITGTINTAPISNELADIGDQIEAELVEPHE